MYRISKILSVMSILFVLILLNVGLAEGQDLKSNVISVSTRGTVKAKPDTAVLLLEVRTTSSLAESALDENNNKIASIEAVIKELNFKGDQVVWSGNQFQPAGGGRYIRPGERVTGFDVFKILQLHIPMGDKTPSELSLEISTVLDKLSKMGASTLSSDISRISLGGTSAVVFILKNPDKYENLAFENALAEARPTAEAIADKLGVKITGIHSVQRMSLSQMILRTTAVPQLEFPYMSTSPDQIIIRANVSVYFSFK